MDINTDTGFDTDRSTQIIIWKNELTDCDQSHVTVSCWCH
jgi:hypothetical protein